ncbi:hypothetical protein HWV62_18018 [Athelia sp. TMB]|nr:hypothetical protein HWV62_18018 [Athelia sp. TMB]
MEEVAEDEKKPFEAEGPAEDETLPDPDEELMLDSGNGRVWLVKVPKHLMERWSAIDAGGVHLASIRVYSEAKGAHGKAPRIMLFLPPHPADTAAVNDPARPTFLPGAAFNPDPADVQPDVYELDMVNDNVENQIVIAERPKLPEAGSTEPVNPRARSTVHTGRVRHNCNLRPVMNATYMKQMRERTRKYNTPQRTIGRIEDAGISGGRGGINMLSSGVGVGSGRAFDSLVASKPKPKKGAFERMARMPKNQLLDQLFSLFREKPLWPIKVLREKTQQPEQYLKETLQEIATLHRSGEHTGMWELSANFKGDGVKGEGDAGPSALGGDVDMDDGDSDDSDESDDDMEEVS